MRTSLQIDLNQIYKHNLRIKLNNQAIKVTNQIRLSLLTLEVLARLILN
jgi:hypothetical protein